MSTLIDPHGGAITELFAGSERAEVLKGESVSFPSITLTARQLCDLELLLCGGFSPLKGFLNQRDYDGVLEHMRLSFGTLWLMPITLDISEADMQRIDGHDRIALRDLTGVLLAILHVGDLWQPDQEKEAEKVFGTASAEHPAVTYLMDRAGACYLGGDLEGIRMPPHYDFLDLRHTPRQLRKKIQS